ncbi:MAG: hypothetical protein LBS86_03795 [Treponema sp.]|nr:hypothetical protein [Treponema sp.]
MLYTAQYTQKPARNKEWKEENAKKREKGEEGGGKRKAGVGAELRHAVAELVEATCLTGVSLRQAKTTVSLDEKYRISKSNKKNNFKPQSKRSRKSKEETFT